MNTAECLQITSMVIPERTALVCGSTRVTYGQMADRVNRLANWLQSVGADPEHPVGSMAMNGVEYIETYYAAAKIGATFVLLNYRATHDELTYMINSSDVHILFGDERCLDLVAARRPPRPAAQPYVCYDKPVEGMDTFREVLLNSSPE